MFGIHSVFNGMYSKENKGCYTNCHLSYKGRSVIVDYEHCLHIYSSIPENVVPIEMYPYRDDIYVGYINLDEEFHKVNIEALIKDLDEALKEE